MHVYDINVVNKYFEHTEAIDCMEILADVFEEANK